VTPIVGGVALKGPTIEMMTAMGMEPSSLEVARIYRDVAAGFVLDQRDVRLRESIAAMGYRVIVCDTVMNDGGERLSASILKEFGAAREEA
jgi:LPPG:FO 2-phospho-L-lactate transferase